MQLLKTRKDSLTVKGTLINVALEKRNAQLICGADGRGLDEIMEMAVESEDSMLMKLARNVGAHEGVIQQNLVVSALNDVHNLEPLFRNGSRSF